MSPNPWHEWPTTNVTAPTEGPSKGKCPRCGGSNFSEAPGLLGWALGTKVCNNCGREL